jgi:PAS domain S-box-containing protein
MSAAVNDAPTLIVVDDALEVRLLVKRQLRLSGAFTVVAEGADGYDAIDLAARHKPDLLLLDVSMPEMGGLEALPRIKSVAPDTAVVLYTGFDEVGLAGRARELGATALLQKSAAIDELPAQLEEIRRRVRVPEPAEEPPAPEEVAAAGNVLDEHLERFREVFEEAAIGMATMTLTGTVVRANRALGHLVEKEVTQLVGLQYSSLAAAEQVDHVIDALRRAQAGEGAVVRVEHAVTTSRGQRLLLATAAPVADARGRPLYLFIQVQDVTAQRSAEEGLRRSEERFKLLVEAVEDYAIFMLDPDGYIASWNAGAQRIKGYRAEEIIGKHFRTFYPQEMQDIGHPEYELATAIREGHYEEEGWRIRKDGSRFWASVVITAVHDNDGQHIGFAKVTRNIDERRQMLLELEGAATALSAANASLESANTRLAQEAADQAQFLAVTAHELRSPVSVLSGSAKLLADHWTDMTEDDRSELFESVRLGAARLQRLLNDLLTASRLESNRIRPLLQDVDLGGVLDRAAAAARASNADADVRLDVPPGLLVLGEPDRLGQAFDNLLSNAMRHGKPPVEVVARPVGDRVEIRVSDAGPGVDPGVRDRLFQRFATGGKRGGTGLGLFIVRELARAYGGDAVYDAQDGRPGAFVVYLLAPRTLVGSSAEPAG